MRRQTRRGWRRYAAIVALAMAPVAATTGASACTGDCNDNDIVAVNELVTMVNISLATQPASACAAGDANENGVVSVDEIVSATGFCLEGCAAAALQPCTGATLTTCAASCGGPGRNGCCPLTSPPACFDPTNNSISFTQCGANPSAACVLGGDPMPTNTVPGGATPTPTVAGGSSPSPTPVVGGKTQVSVVNQTASSATVYVSFGADSAITQSTWSSFCTGSGLSCQFPLAGNGATQALPNPSGAYLNATFAFNSPVGCGATKAEVNVNNPTWYDILDVSLVDGYSNAVAIIATQTAGSGTVTTLGPPNGQSGNESVYGVYPYGCDVCVARCSPPCSIAKSDPLVGCTASCTAARATASTGARPVRRPTPPCHASSRAPSSAAAARRCRSC